MEGCFSGLEQEKDFHCHPHLEVRPASPRRKKNDAMLCLQILPKMVPVEGVGGAMESPTWRAKGPTRVHLPGRRRQEIVKSEDGGRLGHGDDP